MTLANVIASILKYCSDNDETICLGSNVELTENKGAYEGEGR